MSEQILAASLPFDAQKCLLKLEHQLVRFRGFIALPSFDDEYAKQLQEWQAQGHITLDTKELEELPKEMVSQNGITHGCQMSDDLWLASASMRRIWAHGL